MIIGLAGLAGSGKDTVANFIVEKHEFVRVSFADALKDASAVIFSWPRNMLEGDTIESRDWREQVDSYWSAKFGYAVTPRIMLQKFGTDVCRGHLHDNIWINCVEKKLQENHKNNLNTIITDVRFPNEVKMIRNAGGKVFRVKRGAEPAWWDLAIKATSLPYSVSDPRAYARDAKLNAYDKASIDAITNKLEIEHNLHISEWAWAGTSFDSVINNNGTLEDLNEAVTNIVAVYEFLGKDI